MKRCVDACDKEGFGESERMKRRRGLVIRGWRRGFGESKVMVRRGDGVLWP